MKLMFVQYFQFIKFQKGNNGLQGFHNLRHTMFQCLICLDLYKIWVFKNMPTIFWSFLWAVYDVHVCPTFVWRVYDIHATRHHHIYLIIFPVFCMVVNPGISKKFHVRVFKKNQNYLLQFFFCILSIRYID